MSKTTTDHDEIRAWAEKHGGKPAAVDRTHEDGDVGIIRLMFPKARQSEHGSLVEISWEEFFDQFEESGLALIYDDKSNFNKIVGRDTAERREEGENDAARHEGRDGNGRSRGEGGASRKDAAGAHAKDSAASRESRETPDDLKSREYRDAQGEVHHHTRSYMESHGKEKR